MKRILIFGSGVIGSTYGGLLAKSGCNVTLYSRGKRLSDLLKMGLLLQSSKDSKPEQIKVDVISEINQAILYDYVFVTVRKEQINEALNELARINSQNFVFMVNNASGYDEWIKRLGDNKIIPAFPGSGGKIEQGIVFYEIVNRFIQPTTLGELSGKTTSRISDLKKILSKSGFYVSISENMDAWQKSHIALVAPMAAVIYYDGGNNYTVSGNNKAINQMNLALKENFRFLKNSGIGIEPFKLNLVRVTPLWVLNITMKLCFNTKWAENVICNHSLTAKSEMSVIFEEFITLAKSKEFELTQFSKLVNAGKLNL